MGDHDSAPTYDIACDKYLTYFKKIEKFSSREKAVKFLHNLKSLDYDVYKYVCSNVDDLEYKVLEDSMSDRKNRLRKAAKSKKRFFVSITTYNRPRMLMNLLQDIKRETMF